eukprot:190207_1
MNPIVFGLLFLIAPFVHGDDQYCSSLIDSLSNCPGDGYDHACVDQGDWSAKCIKCPLRYTDCSKCECIGLTDVGYAVVLGAVVLFICCVVGCFYSCCRRRKPHTVYVPVAPYVPPSGNVQRRC